VNIDWHKHFSPLEKTMNKHASKLLSLICGVALAITSVASLDAAGLNFLNADFGTGATAFPGADNWIIGQGAGLNEFYTTDGLSASGQGLSGGDPNTGASGDFNSHFLTANRLAGDDSANPTSSLARQLVAIPASDIALVDANDAQVSLEFFYNAWDTVGGGDIAGATVEFFSDLAGTTSLGSITTGDLRLTPTEVWVPKNLKGQVPASTRSLEIQLMARRATASATNVQFDDLSGVIEQYVAPPGPLPNFPLKPLAIVNGGFEDPVVTGGAGQPASTGWTFANDSPNQDWWTTAGIGLSSSDPVSGALGSSQFLTGNRLAMEPDDAGTASDPPVSTVVQLVDLSSEASIIAAGNGGVVVEFYYQQWDSVVIPGTTPSPANAGQIPVAGDFLDVTIEFFDDLSKTNSLGVARGDTLAITAFNNDGWTQASLSSGIPIGTGAFEIQLGNYRGTGSAANVHIDEVKAFITTDALLGDFDNDGDVDGRDFLVWQRDPGVGNLADWQANYGLGGLGAAIAVVPEPASLLLIVLGMTLIGGRSVFS
jgi:hypothetical protein